MVGSPHLSDLVTLHQSEARGVYVGELGATEAVKHPKGFSVVVHVHVARQISAANAKWTDLPWQLSKAARPAVDASTA